MITEFGTDGPATSEQDARERIEACETTEALADLHAELRGGEVADELLWAMSTARFDQIVAARPAKPRRPRARVRRPHWDQRR